MTSHAIQWKTDNNITIGDVSFELVSSDYKKHKTNADRVVLLKGRRAIELYIDALDNKPTKNVLEFGIFEGGSPILFSLLFPVEKFVGIDLRKPVVGLDEFLRNHPVGDRIRIHYETSQDDSEAIRRIVEDEFGDEPIDLIIDDASHQYGLTRRSFEIAFPMLRPGGTYVVEDWGWAHWRNFGAFEDETAMSNFIFELTMICASSPGLIRKVEITPAFVFVTKSPTAPARSHIRIEDLYSARGRSLSLI